MRLPLLALPIVLTIMVSGCTIPGMPSGFCIPGLTCGATVEETHDVIVIESLQALPAGIAPGETIKLVAIVSNVANVNAEISTVPVTVELYDYCEGLFDKITDAEQPEINLLRGERHQLEWTLKARSRTDVPVKTECTLKVRAKYPYATKSITTLHLIDYIEMQRRINEGTYKNIGSYQAIGYGPIKPYLTVEGTQPIPVDKNNKINTALSIQIINKGRGFLSTKDDEAHSTGYTIKEDNIIIKSVSGDSGSTNDIAEKLSTCLSTFFEGKTNGVKLIKGESVKIPCQITDMDVGNVPVESTRIIQVSVGKTENGKPAEGNAYWYEFRKEIKVTVEPRF